MKLRRSLIVPDCHRPYHNKRAYNLMLAVATYVGVDEVVLLGDYADFYPVSRHAKDQRVGQYLVAEVESVNEGLDELDLIFPEARKVYLEGNHELRLEHFLADKAPALFGLTECVELFQMHSRPRWQYIPYGRNQFYPVLGSGLLARHIPLAGNAKASGSRALASHCYGHNHRIEQSYSVGLDGSIHVAFSCGWLGDQHQKVFDYMHTPPQWQLGFALVYAYGPSTFHHEIIHIKSNYTCVANGKVFKG